MAHDPSPSNSAVSLHRHHSLDNTSVKLVALRRISAPISMACLRPTLSKLRCLAQFPNAKLAGSPKPGANAWRMNTTSASILAIAAVNLSSAEADTTLKNTAKIPINKRINFSVSCNFYERRIGQSSKIANDQSLTYRIGRFLSMRIKTNEKIWSGR